jgi:hypothetical protein
MKFLLAFLLVIFGISSLMFVIALAEKLLKTPMDEIERIYSSSVFGASSQHPAEKKGK